MTLDEVAMFLGTSKDQVKVLITGGVSLKSGVKVKLNSKDGLFVTDDDLDAFIVEHEKQEPGRHPPVGVRRQLLMETRHRCGVCEEQAAIIQFHHLVEWSKVKHHDPRFMLAVCGNCHDMCTKGAIDRVAQTGYKAKLAHPEYREAAHTVGAAKIRRDRDMQTLTQVLSHLHRRATDHFLYEARAVYIVIDYMLNRWEGFKATVEPTTFHLYDETAYRLIMTFYSAVEQMFNLQGWMKETRAGDKMGWRASLTDHPKWHDDLKLFESSAEIAEITYRSLYKYIRENYVEIDFDATDAAAERHYKDFKS